MSINWDSYETYHRGVDGALHGLPRAEARQAFERLMNAKRARIQMLRRLLDTNRMELSGSNEAIQDLNDWYRLNVEPDPDEPGRLLPVW